MIIILEFEILTYKNKIKENPQLIYKDFMEYLEKCANRLIMQTINEAREDFKEIGFNYTYFELKAIILNMHYLDVETSYDVESLSYRGNLVLKLRSTPINFYNKNNVSKYDIKMRLLEM